MLKMSNEWYKILPSNFDKFCAVLESINVDSNIALVDDIDCDGQLSCHIAYEILRNKFNNIDIITNVEHGLKSKLDEVVKSKYSLVIIMDSSSELVETFNKLNQVIVIDHHEYDNTISVPNNIILINSKDTKGLECVSAGMLTYILFSSYADKIGLQYNKTLYSLGALTLYSDIVPVDDYVRLCLEKFISDIRDNNIHELINTLNFYCNPLTRSTLAFGVIPAINYTRKSLDDKTVKMCYRGLYPLAKVYIENNIKEIKHLLQYVSETINIEDKYENFIYVDITDAIKYVDKPLKNFKGLICNQLQAKYHKPALVSVLDEDNNTVELSFRSSGIDSLSFIKSNSIDGGGHIQACGARYDADNISVMLDAYDKYLTNAKVTDGQPIPITIDELGTINLLEEAYENEFRFSSVPTKKYSITIPADKIENEDFTLKKCTIGNTPITWYNILRDLTKIRTSNVEEVTLEIVPTMDSHLLNTYVVVATPVGI